MPQDTTTSRRQLLMRIGLVAGAAYATPALLQLSAAAHASSPSGASSPSSPSSPSVSSPSVSGPSISEPSVSSPSLPSSASSLSRPLTDVCEDARAAVLRGEPIPAWLVPACGWAT
jgi:hypothetical protein